VGPLSVEPVAAFKRTEMPSMLRWAGLVVRKIADSELETASARAGTGIAKGALCGCRGSCYAGYFIILHNMK
jgi:hypothetical protein